MSHHGVLYISSIRTKTKKQNKQNKHGEPI